MLKDFADQFLFNAVNRLLATQPGPRAKLARHAGKVARIGLPLVNLSLLVADDGQVEPAPDNSEVATDIQLSPVVLLSLAMGDRDGLKKAQISGDGLFASDLSSAMNEVDWALALRPVLGDIGAARADQFVSGLGRARQQSHDAWGHALAEYAVYEAGLLADKAALGRFAAEVDRLRDDAARMAARLALLESSQVH